MDVFARCLGGPGSVTLGLNFLIKANPSVTSSQIIRRGLAYNIFRFVSWPLHERSGAGTPRHG